MILGFYFGLSTVNQLLTFFKKNIKSRFNLDFRMLFLDIFIAFY
ncbi:hypothetical protein SAMN05428642_103239 [Flaviramulus basaltis]|uniref:Uncharacterized protein n=1 Tax=Flaviramulus basaltis TaxID=369401 RepID=A0A1K2IMM3_9FLAO|nr:hypothetical protein SAMN05428642_103239 [Flaviramulus basaltis]